METITSSDQDPVIISVYYPNVIESPGYIQPRVQIEIGCRSLREPFENRPVISMLDETYQKASFVQGSVQIPSVLPERTFLEKIFLLHEEFQRPEENNYRKTLEMYQQVLLHTYYEDSLSKIQEEIKD